jgi:hypothetical protein
VELLNVRARRSPPLSLLWLAAGAWLGCNALLGIEPGEHVPDGADGAADVTTPDVALPDAGREDATDGDAGELDGGPCVDTQTNRFHCGACNHDCLGGDCVGGRCQPVVVARDRGMPRAIALDGTHVYWSNPLTGELLRAPGGGGAPEIVYAGPAGELGGDGFAVHAGSVYFGLAVEGGGVARCPVAGCGALGPEIVVPDLDYVSFVDVAPGGMLLFVEGITDGRVGRCALPCQDGAEIVATGGLPLRVAADHAGVYWTTLFPPVGAVRARAPGDAEVTLATELPARGLIPFESELVVATLDKGPMAVSKDGGAVRALTSGGAIQTEYVAMNGPVVFYGDLNSKQVLSCPVGGCADGGAVLATAQDRPRAVAVSAKSVYWTNEGQGDAGAIMRVAR